MRSACVMATVQGVLALTLLTLLMVHASTTDGKERWDSTTAFSSMASSSWSSPQPLMSLLRDRCTPDIIDTKTYKTEHPTCSHLAENKTEFSRTQCASVQGHPINVTLHWSTDVSRAASALLAAVLRHVYKYQRVHLAPARKGVAQYSQPNELVIKLAAVLQDENDTMEEPSSQMKDMGVSNVPTRLKLHAWLTKAALLDSACQYTGCQYTQTFYTNNTALAHCGFIDPMATDMTPSSVFAPMVFGIGNDSKTTMQKLQQRAEAIGHPFRPVFVNRTVFERKLLTSNNSFLFVDFDIWNREPNIRIMEPPPCAFDRNESVWGSELDDSIGMLVTVTESKVIEANRNLVKLVRDFKPSPESLRAILDQEAHGVNLEEAACEWAGIHSFDTFGLTIPYEPVPERYTVAIYLCKADPDILSYEFMIRSIAMKIDQERNLRFVRYFINCSDPYIMRKKLNMLFEQSDVGNVLGVVSLTVEGAALASAAAAVLRVPLLLADVVPDEHASGNTTWQAAGRLRHIALAFEHLVNEFGLTRVAVLSQPTTFARHYLAAFQNRARSSLRNFEIPLVLTEQLAMEALQDLQVAKMRVVLVNADSAAADLILATAVKLHMTYTDGFIWILRDHEREPQRSKCTTTHYTVSLFNRVMEDIPGKKLQNLFREEIDHRLWPRHGASLATALMTVSSFINITHHTHTDMLTEIHNDQVMRALDDGLKEAPVTGLNGVQLHYKGRAIEEAFVYVDEWCKYNGKFTSQRLATWRVNATSGSVRDASNSSLSVARDALRSSFGVARDASGSTLSDAHDASRSTLSVARDASNSSLSKSRDGGTNVTGFPGKQHTVVKTSDARYGSFHNNIIIIISAFISLTVVL